jgi:dihydroorotase (multifunctional complex type)
LSKPLTRGSVLLEERETRITVIVDLVLANAKAYVDGKIVECSIAVDRKSIFKISRETNMPKADVKTDLKGLLVLPGLIDAHVHLRDEGKSYKEDFYTGTAAAAAGGFTTVFDMPNNSPVTLSVETLRHRIIAAKDRILVNVGFYSAFPDGVECLERLVREGIVGFKLFMAEQIGGLDIRDDAALLEAFRIVRELGSLTAVHAEDESALWRAEEQFKRSDRNDINAFLKVHSEDAETKAVNRLLGIDKEVGMHLHFCHISAKSGLDAIAEAKRAGLQVTCEVTPHHLFLSTEDLRGIGTLAVTMPPMRDKLHAEALWNGIRDGTVDIIASDHAPHALAEKEAEKVWDVKVGVPGLETTLPLLLTEVKHGRLSIGDIVRLMSEKPSETFKLRGKGVIRSGFDADLTVVDLDKKYRIDAAFFRSKAKYSPFDGRLVEGKAMRTIVRGQVVMEDGAILAEPGSGEIVRRA